MAKKMKEHQIVRCPHCSCEYFDKNARKGKDVGNPVTECPVCKKISYRGTVFEPAIISGHTYFEIKFASLYSILRKCLVFIYLAFIVVVVIMKDMNVAMSMMAAAMLLYVFYEIVRIVHKRSYLKSEAYYDAVAQSLERLENEDYAHMITSEQGIDVESAYYYELSREEESV